MQIREILKWKQFSFRKLKEVKKKFLTIIKKNNKLVY